VVRCDSVSKSGSPPSPRSPECPEAFGSKATIRRPDQSSDKQLHIRNS
jgi:hypothetical protein